MGDSFTIQISSNLINRLAEDEQRLKKKTRKPKPKTPNISQQSQTKVLQKHPSDGTDTQRDTAGPGWPLQPPLFLPVSPPPPPPPPPPQVANPELEAIRSVLQESEKVMEKLQKQEEEMMREVTQKAKELRDKEFKLPYQNPTPCLAEKQACLECYKEYSKDPLKCAKVVNSFADCARKIRQQLNSLS